jgi:hypothetical protein
MYRVGRSSRRRVKVCQQQQSSSYDREASVCSLFKRPISECGIRCITLVVSWSQMSVDRRPVWRIPAVSSASCTRPWSKTCSMRDFRGSSAAWDEAIAGAIPVTCRSSGRRIQLTRCRLRRSAAGVAYCAFFEAIKPNCTAGSISVDTQTYPSHILRLSLLSSHFLRCDQMQKCVEYVQTPSLVLSRQRKILYRVG